MSVLPAPRRLRVGDEDAGLRVDLFLARRLGVSRAQARLLIDAGCVERDGRALERRQKGQFLSAGDTLVVAGLAPVGGLRPVPSPDAPLALLAEGDGWLAVAKPPGLPVHPLRPGETGTVLNAAIARWPEMAGVGEGGLRCGVVHRLDVDTSGVLLLATREETWRLLRARFAAHRLEKVYRAIARGRVGEPGAVELPLRVARSRPARVEVCERTGARGVRACALSWRPLEELRGATLIEARPVTGFLHQVRATFAHLGWPLAGDRVYGPAGDETGAARHMLHASRLSFGDIAVECPDAPDFTALLERLRGRG